MVNAALAPARGRFGVDYSGPYAVPSLDGATGVHDFMDYATGWGVGIPVNRKGDFHVVLRHFLIRYVYPYPS